MADKRSQRKSNVVQFLTKLDRDRSSNLNSFIQKAKSLEIDGFNFEKWNEPLWSINAGRLLKLSGKNVSKLTLSFSYAQSLGSNPLEDTWADLVKSVVVIRFHRSHQSAPNQRNFISAISYVIYEMVNQGRSLFNLTPEYLDNACRRLSKDYSDGVAYNMHKAIGEFAAHCDANGLCNVFLNYKFSAMKRPENTGGLGHKRLDDPETLNTEGDKLVNPKVFKIFGELYLNVPSDHKYRLYVLVLSLIAMLGRRFSEIATLPNQSVERDEQGRAYLKYFPRKSSQGDVFTPIRNLYIPTETASIVDPIISEIGKICFSARNTASEMQINEGPDLSFLANFTDEEKFYKEDLRKLGIPESALDTNGWLRQNNLAFPDEKKLTSSGKLPGNPFWYARKIGLIQYCKRDYQNNLINPIHIDQLGKKYHLKDLLLVKYLGLSSGTYAHWLATPLSHSMLTTFLRYFPQLALKYASSSMEVDFTSHHFRHTLNTLLDEGGLSDLLQTEWFGRSNANDTKAYQHTSREKRALMLRADIKAGKVEGRLVDQLRLLPVSIQDAVIAARINAVHDVGTGICIHVHAQNPCTRHLQCSADCNDYVWVKNDEGRKEELKRMYSITYINRKTAEEKKNSNKPKRSADWILHNEKKLNVYSKQMRDNGIENFDPIAYVEELTNE